MPKVSVAIIILAAGKASQMGERDNTSYSKPLLVGSGAGVEEFLILDAAKVS
jgi:hypothetical protein